MDWDLSPVVKHIFEWGIFAANGWRDGLSLGEKHTGCDWMVIFHGDSRGHDVEFHHEIRDQIPTYKTGISSET